MKTLTAIIVILLLGTAYGCPPNCNDCDPNGEVCFACGQGFQLSVTGQCMTATTIPYCALYGPTRQCFECQPTFSLDSNGNCLKSGSACIAKDSNNLFCITCGFGTLLVNGKCMGSINCKSPSQTCTACEPGFALEGANCVDKTGNCKTVGNNGFCVTCNSGFSLGGYTCQNARLKVFACYIWDANGYCLACKFGYNAFQGQCLLPSQIQQVQQGGQTLIEVLHCRLLALSTTTTTTTAAATNANSGNSFGSGSGSQGLQTAPLPANCKKADPSKPGKCLNCNPGYINNDGVCKIIETTDPNCLSYNLITGVCISCRNEYNFDSNANCIANPTNGDSINIKTSQGSSSSSSSGDSKQSSSTTASSVYSVTVRNTGCSSYNKDSVCTACSKRYYFGENDFCLPVNPLCNSYTSKGACTTCYPGFIVSGDTCIVNSPSTTDPNCKVYTSSICTRCDTGFYYNQLSSLCTPFNPLCSTSNLTNGDCLTCYAGYSLIADKCTVTVQDPNCLQFNAAKTLCLQCSNRYYLSSTGACNQVSPLCKTFNQTNGNCLSCYPGYVIQGIACAVGAAVTIDVNCAQLKQGACTKCSNGYYVSPQGVCTQLNPLCKTSNSANGACLTCYPGYALTDANCVLGSSLPPPSIPDPNCKTSNITGVCTSCDSSHYLSAQATCIKVDPLCRTYTSSKSACASCYDGYSLYQGQCASTQVPNSNNDPYCKKLQGSACITCANGYYLAQSGNCTQLNPLCKDSDMKTGSCLSCYSGYVISGATCVVSAAPYIPFCANYSGIICSSCISGYYVSNGGCAQVNPLCATYDPSNGACWTCITGYVLHSSTCISTPLGTGNCYLYTNLDCTQCMQGYALVNYLCVSIDPNCVQFDNVRNVCTSCKTGMSPQGINCV